MDYKDNQFRIQKIRERPLSYTQVMMFKACPRQWFYEYVEGIKSETNAPVFRFGFIIHEVLSAVLRKEPGLHTISMSKLQEEINSYSWDFARQGRGKNEHLAGSLIGQGLKVLKRDLKTTANVGGKLCIELGLKLDTRYKGFIDLVYVDKEDKLVLLDWKTSSIDYKKHDLLSSLQLVSYAWLLRELYSIEVDYLAYCVLNKKENLAYLLKIRNTSNYVHLHYLVDKTKEEMLFYVGNFNQDLHNYYRDGKSCYRYGRFCHFYSSCWVEEVEYKEIDLVPSFE